MSCRNDVRKAILDEVLKVTVEGRYTFSKLAGDKIQINNSSKVNSASQAIAVAKEVIGRANKEFYGHVSGYFEQVTPYDPVTVTFTVSDKYIEHEYNKLPKSKQTDSSKTIALSPMAEEEYLMSNSDFNSYDQIYSPGTSDNIPVGTFTKFLQFKKNQLAEYYARIAKIQVEKKRKDITKERLTQLNNQERELNLQIEGKFELGIKGLKQEIKELEKDAETLAVGHYVEKDLNRLDKLSKSDNVDDLNEAQRLIDFYDLAGTFRRNIDNPFFEQEDIFLEDQDGKPTADYRLSDETMQHYRDWRARAMAYQNIVDKKKEEVTIHYVNSDPSVQNTYGGKKFSFDQLVNNENGLKDVDWVSMWTMDVTQGIFSHNGVIPQVMFSYLANSFEKKLSWARKIEERIDKITPSVQKELTSMGKTLRGSGILGISGASYQIFKEVTKEGNETGGLIQRFVKEFYDEQSKALNKFYEKFENARLFGSPHQKQVALNKAFEELKRWRRNNTIILDTTKLAEFGGNDIAYRDSLISLLGQKGFDEQIEKQKTLIKKYEAERQSMLETLFIQENVTTEAQLSANAKNAMAYWINNHSPIKGIEDYNSVTGIFFNNRKANNFMDYNVHIPRKYAPTITHANNQYQITDSTRPTKYHNGDFEQIQNSPVLSEFYDIMKEVCETIRENMPLELQQKMTANTLPALTKTSAEIIADKNIGILKSISEAFRHLMERVRLGFGVVKQSEISYATIDPVTGRTNYKVNDDFMRANTKAMEQRMLIEKTKFLQAYGKGVLDIKRFSVLPLNQMPKGALVQLAQYLHLDIPYADIEAGRIDKIRNITGENVEIGKYIRDFSLHSVVQSQSFDLPKIGKYFSNMAMTYAARQEALPILEIMKQHYESIKKPVTNNVGKGLYNAKDEDFMKQGVRTNAIKQMDDWFERVVLDNYGTKHLGLHGDESRKQKDIQKINEKIALIDDKLKNNLSQEERDELVRARERLLIKKQIPKYGKTIYSDEDKRKLGEIETLLKTETDKDRREELIKTKESLGKARTATATFDNIWAWIRTLRLGYNVSSATTNFMEGVTSNMILSAGGEYFDPKEIYYGYHVIKSSFIKNITFGKVETTLARKNRKLMDKFNVVMDSKNELQKSSGKSYASKFSWMNPHELNQRVEYINQSPIMIAMLRTQKIKDKNGVEKSIWDAMDKEGKLTSEFRTPENVKNWEELTGDDYLLFKQRLHKAIVLGHGNYDEIRGMMIKSGTAGKALMMFKTWLPMQLYWRFATEQDDIQSGTTGYRGRYWSYGKGTAALHLGIVGTAAFGPLGAIAGSALGYVLGNYFGTDSGVPMLKEVVESSKVLLKKVVGMPVNVIAGRKVIGTGENAFDSWVKGDFTKQDARNLRANMADITIQLAWLALILAVKGMFWDDDDEPEDAERIAHNILVNKLMQLSSQAAMYVNPVDAYEGTLGSNAVVQYLTDVGKELTKVNDWIHGRDIIQSGINAGESGLANQTKKIFMPGIFKDKALGFGTQAEKVFEESPFHPYFKSDKTVEKEANKRVRAELRHDLQEEGELTDSEIDKKVDEEAPTPTKLKKLGMTREEYDQSRPEQEEE